MRLKSREISQPLEASEVYVDALVNALVFESDAPEASPATYLNLSVGMGFR